MELPISPIITKLVIHKQIIFKNGKFEILGQSVLIMPSKFLPFVLKQYPGSKAILYEFCKMAGKEFGEGLRSNFGLSADKLRKTFEEVFNIAGWGTAIFHKLDYDNGIAHVKLLNSTIAKQVKSKQPVDHAVRGFFAAGGSEIFGKEAECIETQCSSAGKDHCEFVVGSFDLLSKNYKK